MSQQREGLVKRDVLSGEERAAIGELVRVCNEYEGLRMRISEGMFEAQTGGEVLDFLYFVDGMLVGYLGLDGWGVEEKEVVGMVHPSYRRRGIFRALLMAAEEECRKQGVLRLVLICEEGSGSGQAFVKAVGARYDFSEYEMHLKNFQPRYGFDDRLAFRRAESSDVEALAAIQSVNFGAGEEVARERVLRRVQDPTCRYYIATLGMEPLGCEEPVGALRLHEWGDTVGIYGVGVVPEYRGRGYGRQMLEEVFREIGPLEGKKVLLDVNTENTRALNLYRSCGFEVVATYDYFVVEVGG